MAEKETKPLTWASVAIVAIMCATLVGIVWIIVNALP